MNIDKFLKIFVPKDHSFFPLFEADADNLVKAAEELVKLMKTTNPEEWDTINKDIRDIEHIGDEITNNTYQQLNKSFITPFDREDIHELTAHIDDVVDSINGISRRVCLYKPKKLHPVYTELSELILEGAKQIENAIHGLKDAADNRQLIMKACEKVKEIEHNADEVYFSGVSDLFENENDSRELLK